MDGMMVGLKSVDINNYKMQLILFTNFNVSDQSEDSDPATLSICCLSISLNWYFLRHTFLSDYSSNTNIAQPEPYRPALNIH